MNRRTVLAGGCLAALPRWAVAQTSSLSRAMWVWTTRKLVTDPADREAFFREAAALRLTDVYLYLKAGDYRSLDGGLSDLLRQLARTGIGAWGMEGWRGYFSDVEGPAGLYRAADAMILFNGRHPDTSFAGFHSDMEPQDGQDVGRIRFHNGVADGALSEVQRRDRDALMMEWLEIHQALRRRMARNGLAYGAAMPSWVDDYEGEPIRFDRGGGREPLLPALLGVIDPYVVMSYATAPDRILPKMTGEWRRADVRGRRPRVLFSVETHAGAGRNVSYADTPPKASRRAVLADIAAVAASAGGHASYGGHAIHDWEGWKSLPA